MITNPTLEERFSGCLLGGAIGDALGFTSENLSHNRIVKRYGKLTNFKVRPGKGYYTDDTQMTIALAETILVNNGFETKTFRRKLARWWLTPPRLSGRTMKNAGLKAALGLKVTGRAGLGNGGAMRAAPLALFYYQDEKQLYDQTVKATKITHLSPPAVAGALVAVFAVAYCLTHQELNQKEFLTKLADIALSQDEELAQRIRNLETVLSWDDDKARQEILKNSSAIGSPVGDTIITVLYAFLKSPANFEESLIYCVNAGWDTDTIAAICSNISGSYNGVKAIPAHWIDGLENGYKGRNYILMLATNLYHRKLEVPHPNPILDYLADLWRNYCFLANMIVHKPKF